MPYWLYSVEPLPNTDLQNDRGFLPGYTPEYIQYGGVTLPQIPKDEWLKLPDAFHSLRHRDWTDRAGHKERIETVDIIENHRNRLADRGVIVLDHEPSAAEREAIPKVSLEANLAFRRKAVDWYENQVREKEVTGHGRTKPTPYEDQCYSILGISKPYSVEAFKAQRQPGHEAAERIATAIATALKEVQKPASVPAK